MDDAVRAELRALVEPMLADCEMELVELTCRSHNGGQLVRLLVDKVGGVTIRQCAKANQRISEALEIANLIDGRYAIEVSSPGLDRPLVSRRDFERAIGEEVQIHMLVDEHRVKSLEGMLLAVQPEAIVLNMVSGNVTVPMAQIRLAKKVMRW